jgi:molybdopterin adenylyltransferase
MSDYESAIGLVSISDRASPAASTRTRASRRCRTGCKRALRNPIEWQTRLIPDEQAGISAALRELVDVASAATWC